MNKAYMQQAISEAQAGIHAGHGGPFGCVIVKDSKVIGSGHNEVLKQRDPTCHGEVVAIRDACKNLNSHDLSGAVLYTTAEPCPMCLGAILWANIEQVYYGCNIQDTDNIGFRDEVFYRVATPEGKAKLLQECERASCLDLFKEYTELDHKQLY